MNFENYIREVELIIKQNNVEIELYSLIKDIIFSLSYSSKISIRNVSVRRRSDKSKLFYGMAGFPDLIILSPCFKSDEINKDNIYGVVEAKAVGKDILKTSQLIGHIISYNRVLYTNGFKWIYYEYFFNEEEMKFIKEVEKKHYKNSDLGDDYSSFHTGIIDKIESKWEISLIDRNIDGKMNWSRKEWNKLINKLENIEWWCYE